VERGKEKNEREMGKNDIERGGILPILPLL